MGRRSKGGCPKRFITTITKITKITKTTRPKKTKAIRIIKAQDFVILMAFVIFVINRAYWIGVFMSVVISVAVKARL